MRIGFDVSQTGAEKAGCGYFSYSLIQHLAKIDKENEYILYPTFGDFFYDPDWSTATYRINQQNFTRGKGQHTFDAARMFWSEPSSEFEGTLGFPEIVHANNFYCPTRLNSAKLVYTLYDLSFLEHPEWTTETNRYGCFNGVFNASLYSDFIIAISEYSRQHFLEIFPHYIPDRISVIYPASRFSDHIPQLADSVRPRNLIPDEFWLTVGTIEPRKNLERMIVAYKKLKENLESTLPLVLAGGHGWLMEDFRSFLVELELTNDVILLGYVDDETLQWLYQNCFAFIYPSLFEGFGLPVLEAMSLGSAVIASNATSIPEIVKEGGILVDPLQEDEIFTAMLHLQQNEARRSSLKTMATIRSREFSWKHTAQSVLEAYIQLANKEKTDNDPKRRKCCRIWGHKCRTTGGGQKQVYPHWTTTRNNLQVTSPPPLSELLIRDDTHAIE